MKRILGIDYGTKRIGLAISDPMRIIASALKFVPNNDDAIDEILNIAKKYEVEAIVIGIPLNLKGERAIKSEEVNEFIEKLREKSNLKIIEWDERFTTAIAKKTMLEMGLKKKQRQDRTRIDSMSAAILLQSYLNSNLNVKNESRDS